MKLVVDANVLFSFFKKDSSTRKLVADPELKFELELFVPAYILEELRKHKNEICSKSGISSADFDLMLSSLDFFVDVVPKSFFEPFIPEAGKLLPEHPKDVPYLALALKLDCPLWSNEKELKRQTQVKVFSTKELVEFLKAVP